MSDDDDELDDADLTDEQLVFRNGAAELNKLVWSTRKRRVELDLVDAPREVIVERIAAKLQARAERSPEHLKVVVAALAVAAYQITNSILGLDEAGQPAAADDGGSGMPAPHLRLVSDDPE